ncbi:MAG: hypothetical protein ACXVJ7_08400 [Acidimicrobiia bacterium]
MPITEEPRFALAFTDEELAAQALAADPDAPLDSARPLAEVIGPPGESTLPEWYMPPVMRGISRLYGWRRGVVLAFVASLLLIEAFGLCSTYGQIL